MLSVLLWYTDSDYTLGIFWPLCCLVFYDIQILITPLVSFGHCVVCSSMIYRFWLPLGIFWPLCCLFFYDIQILITPLVSFGHCVFCSSMIYRFWLHPWYLLVIVLSVLLWYTDSDYTFGIFWSSVLLWYTDSDYTLGVFRPLCCLFFYDFGIVITPLVSFGHCVVCSLMSYGFWLHPWYLLAIVFFVLLWYTDSDYTLGIFWPSFLLWYTDSDYTLVIFWPLCCLFFYDIQILITPLVSFGHCVVCSSMIYRFWLHPWYLLVIVLSVLLWYTDSDYPLVSFGHCVVWSSMIYRFWLSPWYLLAIVLSVLLRYTDSDYPLVSFGHCVVFSSMIYRFWLHPWYLLAIVLSVLLWYTDSDYPLGIFWAFCCLFFYDLQILITPLVSFGHCVVCSSMIYRFWLHPWYLLAIVFSVLLWYTDSDYPLVSFGHCVVCSSMIYRFWLPPWYLLAIVFSVLLWYTDSDYTLGIFWPLCCLFFYDIQILINPLVSFGHCVVCSSMIYRNLITPLLSVCHCVVCSSMIYRFWLPPWHLLAIVLSVLLWYTDSGYTLGIFWVLCCLFLYDIQILITPLVSFGNCVVCSSMIYRFWLHPWYLLAIVLSVLLWYTDSDYTLGIFWSSVLLWYTYSDYTLGIFRPLCCLFFYDLGMVITPLVSFGHCVVNSLMSYGFWLYPWYLLAIVFSVLLWYTDSDYTLVMFCPLCCLFFYDIQILIIPWYLLAIVLSVLLWYTDSDYPLVSFGHCVVCFSMIYRFWFHPWYLSAIVLSVLLWLTDSDFPLGIFWQLCFLFFYDLRILNIPWYLLDIVLFVLLWFIDSDYTLGIFWPLCCLFFYDIQILINPLVSFGHCVVCSSMIYRFWLHPWYLLAIVLSVLLWYTDSDYTLGIFWSLCCLFFYDIQILIPPLVSFGHQFFYDIQILITPLVSFGHCVVCSSMI